MRSALHCCGLSWISCFLLLRSSLTVNSKENSIEGYSSTWKDRTMTTTNQEWYQDLGQFTLKSSPSAAADKKKNLENGITTTHLPRSSSSCSCSSSSSLRILQLTDLHIFPRTCQTFKGIALGDSHQACRQLVAQLIAQTAPDVVILTGDIIDGRGPWNNSVDAVTEAIQDLLPAFGPVPWLYIPGNHDDDDSPWSRADLMRICRLPGCLQHKATGFHHTLLLRKNSTSVRLHLFDSGGNHPDPAVMYECIPREVVEGFGQYMEQQQQQQQQQQRLATTVDNTPELVFLHIPTPEYQYLDPVVGSSHLFQAALHGGKVPFPWNRVPWLVRWLGLHRIAGCTRGPDSGLFPACVQANCRHDDQIRADKKPQPTFTTTSTTSSRIISFFCGHDHHSDAVFWREGIFLAYGRSGACTPPFDWEGKAPNPLQPGGRVIQVSSSLEGNQEVTTWIETASGMEMDSFLNMTKYRSSQS